MRKTAYCRALRSRRPLEENACELRYAMSGLCKASSVERIGYRQAGAMPRVRLGVSGPVARERDGSGSADFCRGVDFGQRP